MSALQTLRSIDQAQDKVQTEQATGLRISTARDNAAYWSIATTMRSEVRSVSAVSDSIHIGQAILDVTYNGLDAILKKMDEFKQLVVMAANEGRTATNSSNVDWLVDPIYDQSNMAKIDKQLRNILIDIGSIAASSSFNGVNLLRNEKNGDYPPTSSIKFVTGINGSTIQTKSLKVSDTLITNYDRNGDYYMDDPLAAGQGIMDGKVRFVTFDIFDNYYNGSYVDRNIDIYVMRDSLHYYETQPGYQAQPLSHYFDVFIDELDQKIEKITSGMATVGALQKSMQSADETAQLRQSTLTKGIGRLVDADMGEVSSRAKALQVQQELSRQVLQIANSNSERIAQLFR